MLSRRRWQSIDRKLPLMASGLVLGTVATLGFVAYLLFEHALVTRAEGRLVTSARGVGMVITRPNVQLRDTLGNSLDGMLVGFVPQIEGSEDFDEPQIIDAIARTDYDQPVARQRTEAPPPGPALTREGGVFRRFLDGFRYR